MKQLSPHPMSIADGGDLRANAMELEWLLRRPFGGAMHSISSSVFEEKARIEFFSTPFHHQKDAGGAESCPFPLLLGLLHPQWTMDGEESCLFGSYGAVGKRHGDDRLC